MQSFYNKQRRQPTHSSRREDKQANGNAHFIDGVWGGAGRHQKTTEEGFRSADCMDTVVMQMVYAEMGGQERKGRDINNTREQGHRDVLDRCAETQPSVCC